jgi:hypothetical protein
MSWKLKITIAAENRDIPELIMGETDLGAPN